MPAAIETDQLTKFYGEFVGLRDLDLVVEPGEVFGLIGPNGAGKTTTIRLLLDFIKPTHGSARVLGLDTHAGSQEIRRRTGYLPGDFITYPNLTADQIFDYFANLRGGDVDAGRKELCERFRLDSYRKFGELSRGNRQKVGLVQAYMGHPELAILDEPTSGLDPLLQIEFLDLVKERRAAGVTQFVSSHLLPEVEAVCDRVGIIKDGRLIALETIDALRARARATVTIGFKDGAETRAADAFSRIPGVEVNKVSDSLITLRSQGDIDSVVKTAARFEIASFESHPPALDEVFMAYYNGEPAVEEAEDQAESQ